VHRSALLFLGAGSPLLLASLWFGAVTPFLVLAIVFPVALMALGAVRPHRAPVAGSVGGVAGRAGRWRVWLLPAALVVLLLLLEASFLAMLNLRGRVAEASWPLGIPLATWIELVGVGLLPLLFVPAVYAAVFGRRGLSPEDLERVRAARREVEAAGTSRPPEGGV
jgi:hypothetical protein